MDQSERGITFVLKHFHKPRKDVKFLSWFPVQKDLFEHVDFYEFSRDEILAYLYILSRSCDQNSHVVFIHFAHTERMAKFERELILRTLEKLKPKYVDLETFPGDVTATLRARFPDPPGINEPKEPNESKEFPKNLNWTEQANRVFDSLRFTPKERQKHLEDIWPLVVAIGGTRVAGEAKRNDFTVKGIADQLKSAYEKMGKEKPA